MDFQHEIDQMRMEEKAEEKRMRDKMEEESRIAENNLQREIEMERAHRRNMLDIEISQLRAQYDARIEEIFKNRYQGLEIDGDVESSPEYKAMLDQQRERIERELEQERVNFAREAADRRARFDKDMRVLLELHEAKRIDFLKKAIVPLVKTNGVNRVMDESVFESRHRIKITRNALKSGGAWALYKAQYHDKPILCKVTVLVKMPVEFRKNIDQSVKCMRFLSEKPLSEFFIKLYDVFATDQKLYTFMDELKTGNLASMITSHIKIPAGDQQKWSRQICQALLFMHRYAIAHLCLKTENIIFSDQNDVRVIGLSHSFCYFNLDQERMTRVPMMKQAPYNYHLPKECFVEDFLPQQADVWSFGLLISEMALGINTGSTTNMGSSPQKPSSRSKVQVNKIRDPSQRSLVEAMLNQCFALRPRLEEIANHEYIGLGPQNLES